MMSCLFRYFNLGTYNRYYFQLLVAEAEIAQGFFGIIKEFGWKRVGIITQNENLFTVVRKVKHLYQCIY